MLIRFNWAIRHANGETEQGKLIAENEKSLRDFLQFNLPTGSVITAITPDDKADTGNRLIFEV
jgi:hypothetical protein